MKIVWDITTFYKPINYTPLYTYSFQNSPKEQLLVTVFSFLFTRLHGIGYTYGLNEFSLDAGLVTKTVNRPAMGGLL